MTHTVYMNLSDSLTVSYPDTWLHDVRAAWLLIVERAAVDASEVSSSEQVRSLHVLVAQLCAQTDADQWESVVAATYTGLVEASANRVYETLADDLWQTMSEGGGRWDVAARLWPARQWVEESLGAVVRAIAAGEPSAVRAAIDNHLGGVVRTLDA